MSKTYLVCGDSHSHYLHNNDRATWLGKLINDIKPDTFVHIGDSADMPSMSSYDKGKKSFEGRTYLADINSHLDFQTKLWDTVKSAKKKLPQRIFCEGNHENRIKKAINLQPELDGIVSFKNLELDSFYDEVVEYTGQTPGLWQGEGVSFGHFLVAGIMGRPVGGEHIGHTLLCKRYGSSVVGHNHLFDVCFRTDNSGGKIIGLSTGCYIDYEVDWAGLTQNLWWRGALILRDVYKGSFDLEQVSLKRMKREYA